MNVIGLMSGTSADGVDVALCQINGAPPHIEAQVLAAQVKAYTLEFQQRILKACQHGHVEELCVLNVEMAELFAQAVHDLLRDADVAAAAVDLIGSHGQTVWHNVLPDGSVNATLQLVESAVLAERTGITTISNFRARDVAAGGQGAPLTGYVDYLLLRHPEQWRAVQNIGGMANVTFLPPLSAGNIAEPITFDTGPGNVLIDAAVHHFTAGAAAYDRDGDFARRGRVNEEWLFTLLEHPYYARSIPKTTGRELFGVQMTVELLHQAQQHGLSPEDVIATLTMLTAVTITEAYRRFAPAQMRQVILGGGGRHNPVLVAALRDLLAPAEVLTHEDIGLNSDHKEALVFAVLAHETWHARPGTHRSLTGVRHPVVLGQITPGLNYVELIQKTWCK